MFVGGGLRFELLVPRQPQGVQHAHTRRAAAHAWAVADGLARRAGARTEPPFWSNLPECGHFRQLFPLQLEGLNGPYWPALGSSLPTQVERTSGVRVSAD